MKSARIKIVIINAKHHNGFMTGSDYAIDGGRLNQMADCIIKI